MFLIKGYSVILFGLILKLIFKAGVIMIEVLAMFLDKMSSRNLTDGTKLILFAELTRLLKMGMNSWLIVVLLQFSQHQITAVNSTIMQAF
jgi:hypothetical protein